MKEQLSLFEMRDQVDDEVSQLASLIHFNNQVDELLLRDAFNAATGYELFPAVLSELARIYGCHTSEVLPRLRTQKREEIVGSRLNRPGKKPVVRVNDEHLHLFKLCSQSRQ